jgi:glutaminyl-tRNA synthetase
VSYFRNPCDLDEEAAEAEVSVKVTTKVAGICTVIKHRSEVRLYDRLFIEAPDSHKEKKLWNSKFNSLEIVKGFVEPSLVSNWGKFQFQRLGYFNTDKDSREGKLVLIKQLDLKTLGRR